MLSPPRFPSRAPGLLTGYAALDNEHRLLLSTIERLSGVCQNPADRWGCGACPTTVATPCKETLVDLLGDLVGFLFDHFRSEESLMRNSGIGLAERELCERHKEDHAAISQAVQEIIAALDAVATGALLANLQSLLAYWEHHHIELHDRVLARLLPNPGLIAPE